MEAPSFGDFQTRVSKSVLSFSLASSVYSEDGFHWNHYSLLDFLCNLYLLKKIYFLFECVLLHLSVGFSSFFSVIFFKYTKVI